jgi:hypothetical protein
VEKGSYKGRRVNLADYAASLFTPHLYSASWRALSGCGASALALLTGVPPEKIARLNRSAHYSDEFMVRFLRRHGFRVMELTMCRVSSGIGSIRKEHVVLLSQLLMKNEGTWGVIHGGAYFHNFDIYALEVLSLLNKPVLSAYAVLHSSWSQPRLSESKTRNGTKSRRRGVPFSALGIAGESQL